MRFATPAEAVEALCRAFGPPDADWQVPPGTFRPVRPTAGANDRIKRFHGPLLRTMHFGLVTLDLDTGALAFVDEDHRDGGDWPRAGTTLPPEWLEALGRLAW